MGFYEYIGSQFKMPRGVIGDICCCIMNIVNKLMYETILKELHISSASKVLDIGYGNGYLIQKIYSKSRSNIYGIDVSEDALRAAVRRNKKGVTANKIKLSVGDCCSTNYENDFFDVATTVNTIYFWRDTNQGMEEICRVLKPGGVFLNVFYQKSLLERTKFTKTNFHLYEPGDVAAIAKKVGFSKVTIKSISHQRGFLICCIK